MPVLLALLVAAAILPATAVAQAVNQPPYWGYGYGPWHGWAGMIMGPLMMILFIGGIVVLVVLLVRWLGVGHHPSSQLPARTALDILKERYARGEIDKAEFEEKRRDIGG